MSQASFANRRRTAEPQAPLPELSMVEILSDATTIEGDHVPAGSRGTIVGIWRNGEAYEVEFVDALGPATVEAADVRASPT